jgi:Tfp pilus assembly protein PilO
MKILSSQKKLFLILAVSLIVLVIFIWLLVLPLLDKIKTASYEYLSNQETLYRLAQAETSVRNLEKSYQEKQDDLSKVAGAFLSPEEIVGFISTLERTAEQTNNIFEIQTTRPLTEKKEEIPSFYFRLSLWGSFSNLLRFLANLENIPYPPYRLIKIESLTIKRLSERDLTASKLDLKVGDIQSILNIRIYTQ